MGGAWAGLWVAVLPHKGHKGHKGHKPATSQPVGNAGQLEKPWACCCRISRRLTRNRGHPPANVKE